MKGARHVVAVRPLEHVAPARVAVRPAGGVVPLAVNAKVDRPGAALAASLLVGGGMLASVSGCASGGATAGPVIIDAASPEALLASLKAAAGQSFNRYLEALRSATDCERLPDFCRLLQAREDAAKERERRRRGQTSGGW